MNKQIKSKLMNTIAIKQYLVLFIIFTTLISGCTNMNSTKKDTAIELSITEKIIETERVAVIKRADQMLNERPITVTDTFCVLSAGNIHDYYSEGTYWWQNPDDPDGKYIRKDGMKNPDNFVSHEKALIKFSWTVGSLTSAYCLSGKKEYANAAIKHLKAWFVDTATMMNPSLLFAQAIKGRCTGRGIGIIDANHLIEVAKSVSILEKTPFFKDEELTQIKSWFNSFLNWLYTHPYGISELNWKNNHGTWCNAQAAAYARLVGNNSVIDSCRRHYKSIVLPNQMARDGSFPLELERTKPYAYSLFSIDAMTTLVYLISDEHNNFWYFILPDRRTIKKGVDFIFPYVEDRKKWTFAKDVAYWEEQPGRRPFMFLAAMAYNESKYIDVWKTINPTYQSGEAWRNAPLKNPLLWIKCSFPKSRNDYKLF